jgi:hypothetical protein
MSRDVCHIRQIKVWKQATLAISFTPVSFLAYSSVLNMEVTCSCQWSVDRLHGILSQRI